MGKVFVFALLAFALLQGCSQDAFVDRITVVNQTSYPAHVEVRGGGGDSGWLVLTTVGPHGSADALEVLDQGSVWIFKFAYAGLEDEVKLARTDLSGNDWTVDVPSSFESALRSRGVPNPGDV